MVFGVFIPPTHIPHPYIRTGKLTASHKRLGQFPQYCRFSCITDDVTYLYSHLHLFVWADRALCEMGFSELILNWFRLGQNGTNLGILKIRIQYNFWLGFGRSKKRAKMYWKLIFNGTTSDIPALMLDIECWKESRAIQTSDSINTKLDWLADGASLISRVLGFFL